MYMNKLLSVSKVTNGFVIECHVPLKPKEDKDGDAFERSAKQQYVVKDESELTTKIKELIPLLSEKYSSEEQFAEAFEKASKE